MQLKAKPVITQADKDDLVNKTTTIMLTLLEDNNVPTGAPPVAAAAVAATAGTASRLGTGALNAVANAGVGGIVGAVYGLFGFGATPPPPVPVVPGLVPPPFPVAPTPPTTTGNIPTAPVVPTTINDVAVAMAEMQLLMQSMQNEIEQLREQVRCGGKTTYTTSTRSRSRSKPCPPVPCPPTRTSPRRGKKCTTTSSISIACDDLDSYLNQAELNLGKVGSCEGSGFGALRKFRSSLAARCDSDKERIRCLSPKRDLNDAYNILWQNAKACS